MLLLDRSRTIHLTVRYQVLLPYITTHDIDMRQIDTFVPASELVGEAPMNPLTKISSSLPD